MSKELYVRREDDSKRISYLIKEFLAKNDELILVSSHLGAGTVARVCNNLTLSNYVTISNVQTRTDVVDERRKINFTMKVQKTKEFDGLYAELLKKREEIQKNRENATKTENN